MRKRSLERILAAGEHGQILIGTVTNVMPYGAFVDLGAIDGLVHISEVTGHRIYNLNEILHPGMPVRVIILQIDEQGERISLSMRKVPR
jgi:small subunit ribosomal protein S1